MGIGSLLARVPGGLVLPWLLAACGGGDLLLPSGSAPARLEEVSGGDQEAQVGATLPEPLVVRATDAADRPVQGVLIVFSFDGEVGGQVAPDTAITNSEGRAEAEVRLGTTSGAQLVDAAVVNGPPDMMVTFRLTALLPPDDGGDDEGGGGGGDEGGGGDGGNGGGNGGGGDHGGGDDDDEGHDD